MEIIIQLYISRGITTTDKIPTKLVSSKNYKIHPPDDGRIRYKQLKGMKSFTDGSVLQEKTGCGVHTILEDSHL